MAVVGYLGKDTSDCIIFQASDETVETVRNFVWSGSARYATHERVCGNALTEFTGLDTDKISFDIDLLAQLGVDPMKEMTKIWTYQRKGIAISLVLGEHAYGRYRWNITSNKNKAEFFDEAGNIYHAVVSITLQEYLKS